MVVPRAPQVAHSEEEPIDSFRQTKRIECPRCGWIHKVTISVEGEMTADAVQGARERVSGALKEAIKAQLADTGLEAANAWIEMPACPHCGDVYCYNV
jgi:hypothetical protein